MLMQNSSMAKPRAVFGIRLRRSVGGGDELLEAGAVHPVGVDDESAGSSVAIGRTVVPG
jgi:hypothetical protein